MKAIVILIFSMFIVSCASQQKADTGAKKAATKKEAKKASKPKSTGTASTDVNCVVDKDQRQISIVKNADGGCDVTYTKNGESKNAASAKHDHKYCEEVFNRIKGNLESAGFKCE